MAGFVMISRWVVVAPTTIRSPSTLIPESPRPDRSTTTVGLFSRCFSTGMKVCPPASALASGSARAATASATVPGLV